MAKMTAKYKTAVTVARKQTIPVTDDQIELYSQLNAAGFFWDSTAKEWQNYGELPSEKPTNIIYIRCWADAERVGAVADEITEAMDKVGYSLLDRSQPYPCRPPKQLESRIYLQFTR